MQWNKLKPIIEKYRDKLPSGFFGENSTIVRFKDNSSNVFYFDLCSFISGTPHIEIRKKGEIAITLGECTFSLGGNEKIYRSSMNMCVYEDSSILINVLYGDITTAPLKCADISISDKHIWGCENEHIGLFFLACINATFGLPEIDPMKGCWE